MDLRHLSPSPSAAEIEAVERVLGPESTSSSAPSALLDARARRHLLLPVLRALQNRIGWISPGGLGYACQRLHVPPAEGHGVASFYAMLSLQSRPRAVLHVCDDIACSEAGACGAMALLEERAGPPLPTSQRASEQEDHAATTAPVAWVRSPCLGLCDRAPAALLSIAGEHHTERALPHASADTLLAALDQAARHDSVPHAADEPLPQQGEAGLRLLARVGVVDPDSLDDYRAHGGYEGLRIALERGPGWVLRELSEAGLQGRGGAAFPTGKKWEAVARQPAHPRYIVCNADESEPGTFKDRVLLEGDPFAVIEAMTIAGLTTGAEQGFLYLRGEYPLAAERLTSALEQARARRLLGSDVAGTGRRFDIELRQGAGAYICGEETALFRSIEGYRGEPATKPPFPVEAGLFGKPTAINNVETLVAALDIVRHGAARYRSAGTPNSPGTRLFCLSGAVQRRGVYEVPFGTTLRALIEKAGGPPAGSTVRAVLLGGAAGTFVGPDQLDLPLTFEDARRAGVTLGSGVVLVLDERSDLSAMLLRLARFFREESCGQCVPCRVGTVRQHELLLRVLQGTPRGSIEEEIALYKELSQAMRDASICGLGQTANSAVESAIVRLRVLDPRSQP